MIIDLDNFNSTSKRSRVMIECECDKCKTKKYIMKSDIFRRGNDYTLCQKCTVSNTGKKNLGSKRTDEFKKNRSIVFKEQYRLGIRKSHGKINSGSFKKGVVPINKGKTHLDYPNIRHGENSTNWKGGVTSIGAAIRTCNLMLIFKKFVLERDNYKCVKCGINKNDLEIHHIIPISVIIKKYNIQNVEDSRSCDLLWDTTNGITVCKDCHMKLDKFRRKRKSMVKNDTFN